MTCPAVIELAGTVTADAPCGGKDIEDDFWVLERGKVSRPARNGVVHKEAL